MPTVLGLDVSLSMSRPVAMNEGTEEYQRRNLAIHGINCLLDHFATHFKLEFTSLIVFSYLWEQLVPFTRDFESIKTALTKVEEFNKTCLEAALSGIDTVYVEEWGTITPGQVILVTDECAGHGPGSLKKLIHSYNQKDNDSAESCPVPFVNSCKLNILLIANPGDKELQNTISMYEKLIELNGSGGEVFVPEGSLSLKSVQAMFQRFIDKYYKPFFGVLQCGNMKCPVQLYPPPEPYKGVHEYSHKTMTVSDELEICGFLEIADVGSPAAISKHLVLPISSKKEKIKHESGEASEGKEGESSADDHEDGKSASFTVLLHGSLKVEGMVAITKISEGWYGMLYSWADSKKKSNLMISLFEPGDNSLSWLGSIKNLSNISQFSVPPYGEDDNKTPFPIRPTDKRSYAQSCVVWIKPAGLQADLQKVLRHARKLPEKQQQFYKELNRLRRAALSFGFLELLEAMANMLERECTLLPGTAHPDAALQLTHAAKALRSKPALDVSQTIMPLRTNFSEETS